MIVLVPPTSGGNVGPPSVVVVVDDVVAGGRGRRSGRLGVEVEVDVLVVGARRAWSIVGRGRRVGVVVVDVVVLVVDVVVLVVDVVVLVVDVVVLVVDVVVVVVGVSTSSWSGTDQASRSPRRDRGRRRWRTASRPRRRR